MGRATRWLRGLFGIKKAEKKNNNGIDNSGRDSGGLCHNPATIPPNISASEAAWLRSYYSEKEDEQNKHAIAVAAATAAAADAAVAAAQAAVAVVRLTSHGRDSMFAGGRERLAATKIQIVFRGYLARKALRALKGLVKLQALVRGYLVRKQAAATLHSMQALIRAQSMVRYRRNHSLNCRDSRLHPELLRVRRSVERNSESGCDHTASFHSRRLSASFDTIDEITKIVEMDTGSRPKSISRRSTTNMSISDIGDDPLYQTISSPVPYRNPPRLSIPSSRTQESYDWGEYKFSTAQSTPRFASNNPPLTPSKSVCGDSFFQHCSNFPNYMANTQSFNAKLRSQSAPKQRPEPSPKKRLTLNDMMEARTSLSGVRMHRSCSQAQEVISFKNAVMGKLDRSTEFVRVREEPFAKELLDHFRSELR